MFRFIYFILKWRAAGLRKKRVVAVLLALACRWCFIKVAISMDYRFLKVSVGRWTFQRPAADYRSYSIGCFGKAVLRVPVSYCDRIAHQNKFVGSNGLSFSVLRHS
jgi:hypothetical protein